MIASSQRSLRNGFALIELLVVISIIALLISLLLPAMAKTKRRVTVLYCAANMQHLGIGLMAYVVANDFNYPSPRSSSITNIWMSGDPTNNRQNLI